MKKAASTPVPQGLYKIAVRNGDAVQTSGMTPRRGNKLLHAGVILKTDDPQQHREAVHIATANAVSAMQSCLEVDERVHLIAQLVVYIAAEPGFTMHAEIADHASNYLLDAFGEKSIGTRAAIGVASLPSNAPVEIVLTAIIEQA